ncbi:MAG: AMP-binding protein [Gemmataceae bacterium]
MPPSTETVQRRFAAVVAACPDRPAVSDLGRCQTYRQFAEALSWCQQVICQNADSARGPVVLCTTFRADLIAQLLGVIHSGRPFLCIDPRDPPARLQALIASSQPSLLIADESVRRCVPSVKGIGFDSLIPGEGRASKWPPHDSDPGDPCCLVQTSGSSGTPRGVCISHRSMLHSIDHFRRTLEIKPTDRLSLLTTPRFGAANTAIFGSLLSGACVCPFDVKAHGLAAWCQWLHNEQISILHTTPSLFRLLAQLVHKDSLPHLRAIKLGGETTFRSDAFLFRARFAGHCVLLNGLGMSEAGGNICHFVLAPHDVIPNEETLPVGRPLVGHTVTLLSDDGNPAAPGAAGEIVVRGAFLANQRWPAQDASVSQEDSPRPNAANESVLHTGDLGRFLPTGDLVHLGRKDRIVKLRGQRVDLGLLEAEMLQLPSVRNVAVLLNKSGDFTQSLVAHVQPATATADVSELREQLARILPAYMVPQQILLRPELPLTASGKIDKQALARLQPLPRVAAVDMVPPRNHLEARIATIWSAVLKVGPVSAYDDFFALGGDSLTGMEIIRRLSQELDEPLALGLLINHPTVAQMAESIAAGFTNSQVEPWFRKLRASVLPLRPSGDKSPLVFIPGGYTSENELMVFAALLPYLNSGHPVLGIRFNLLARRVLPPWSMAGLARTVARKLARKLAGRVPVVVGECLACSLALETSRRLAGLMPVPPKLILLDPWQPRLAGQRSVAGDTWALRWYFRILQAHRPRPYLGEVHIIRCRDAESNARASWQPCGTSEFHYQVAGNHHTYIRQHRQALAQLLNAICKPTGNPFVGALCESRSRS